MRRPRFELGISAWEADVLPLYYQRIKLKHNNKFKAFSPYFFMAKTLPKNQRHVRWNCEPSPDSPDPEITRMHLVVADNKDLSGTITKIILQDGVSFGSVEQIRETKGKVTGSNLRYLFRTYDGYIDPRKINPDAVGKIFVRDQDLRERASGSEGIEEYVAGLYS